MRWRELHSYGIRFSLAVLKGWFNRQVANDELIPFADNKPYKRDGGEIWKTINSPGGRSGTSGR